MSDIGIINATNNLTAMLYLCVCLGIMMIFFFALLIKKAVEKNSLSKYRSKDQGMADLLNYSAIVDDGIIVLKNGALMRSWMYRGPDEANLTNLDRNYISERLNDIFRDFDSGWVIHVDAIRHPVPNYFEKSQSFFKNKIAEAIDQERRNFFADKESMYDGFFILTATWYPPKIASRKIADAMFENNDKGISNVDKTKALIQEFKEKSLLIENQLKNCFESSVEPLKSYDVMQENGSVITYDALLTYLNFCISGEWHPMQLPNVPVNVDDLLAQDVEYGIVPVIGNKYVMCVAIDTFPSASSAGIFNYLTQLGCSYRWSTRYIGLERHEASSAMKKLRKGWEQKQRGFFAQLFRLPNARLNIDAVEMVEQANLADAEISRGDVSFGYLTDNIILMDQNLSKIKSQANDIIKMLSAIGIKARIETINTFDAFLGSLPAHAVENVRRPLVSTINVADMLPVYSPWSGETTAPCPFKGYEGAPALLMGVTGDNLNTPFALNLHHGDLGHSLILGPTGAGKSTLLATLVAQFMRYQGMSIFAFDKGMSLYCLCKATNGDHYIPAGEDSSLAFAPLNSIETDADRSWANDWLQSIAELNGIQVTPSMVNLIDDALKNMIYNKKRAEKEALSYSMTISNFATEVQDLDLREVLSQYISGSAQGALLDSEKDGLGCLNNALQVFEIESLMNLNEKYSLPVLTYIFHCIQKNLTGQPALIVLDEAWLMLSNKTFAHKIKEWLKVLRKSNCAVIMATQSLSDLEKSGIMDVLIESCPTKIFLPNENARQEETQKMYLKFGLNSAQIDLISKGIKKRDYFYFSSNHSRMFQLALGRFTLAFVAVSDKDSIADINDLIDKYGTDWVDEYLKKKGLTYPDGLDYIE